MARNIESSVNNIPRRMFTLEQRLFLCLGKEKEEEIPTLCQGSKNKWPEA